MLTTNQMGWVAETAVIHECAKLGVPVAKPLDDQRYDLVLDLGTRFLRVQCKWSRRVGDSEQPSGRYPLGTRFEFRATLGALLGP